MSVLNDFDREYSDWAVANQRHRRLTEFTDLGPEEQQSYEQAQAKSILADFDKTVGYGPGDAYIESLRKGASPVIGAAEPDDFRTNPEKYGYKDGQTPLQQISKVVDDRRRAEFERIRPMLEKQERDRRTFEELTKQQGLTPEEAEARIAFEAEWAPTEVEKFVKDGVVLEERPTTRQHIADVIHFVREVGNAAVAAPFKYGGELIKANAEYWLPHRAGKKASKVVETAERALGVPFEITHAVGDVAKQGLDIQNPVVRELIDVGADVGGLGLLKLAHGAGKSVREGSTPAPLEMLRRPSALEKEARRLASNRTEIERLRAEETTAAAEYKKLREQPSNPSTDGMAEGAHAKWREAMDRRLEVEHGISKDAVRFLDDLNKQYEASEKAAYEEESQRKIDVEKKVEAEALDEQQRKLAAAYADANQTKYEPKVSESGKTFLGRPLRGLDSEYKPPQITVPSIVQVAHSDWQKGVDVILAAVEPLARRYPAIWRRVKSIYLADGKQMGRGAASWDENMTTLRFSVDAWKRGDITPAMVAHELTHAAQGRPGNAVSAAGPVPPRAGHTMLRDLTRDSYTANHGFLEDPAYTREGTIAGLYGDKPPPSSVLVKSEAEAMRKRIEAKRKAGQTPHPDDLRNYELRKSWVKQSEAYEAAKGKKPEQYPDIIREQKRSKLTEEAADLEAKRNSAEDAWKDANAKAAKAAGKPMEANWKAKATEASNQFTKFKNEHLRKLEEIDELDKAAERSKKPAVPPEVKPAPQPVAAATSKPSTVSTVAELKALNDVERRVKSEGGFIALPSWRSIQKAAAKIGFRYADQLSQFFGRDRSLSLDKKLAMTRASETASVRTSMEKAVNLQNWFKDKAEADAIGEYLMVKDELTRAQQGIQQSGGRDVAQLQHELQQAAARVDPARLQRAEAEYRAWMDEVYDRLQRAGVDVGKRENYVPHVVLDWLQDDHPYAMGAGRSVSRSRPTTAKAAEGSLREIETNPYRAGALADYLSRKAELKNEFARDVLATNDQAPAIRGGTPFDRKKHAMYSFGGPGKAEMLHPVEAENWMQANKQQFQSGQPVKIGGKEYSIIGRDLAEALIEAGEQHQQSRLGRLFSKGTSVIRDAQLRWNPTFQFTQVLDDFMTAIMNTNTLNPLTNLKFAKDAVLEAKKLAAEYIKVHKGEFSQYIEKYRKAGLISEEFDTMLDYSDPAGVQIAEGAIPTKFRDSSSLLGRANTALGDLSQIRESALKIALAKLYEQQGATPERAAYWANRTMGNYITGTPSGRILTRAFPLTKWAAEMMLRLTVDIARDAVTGKNSVEGFARGPVPKMVAWYMLTQIINHRSAEVSEDAANMPSHMQSAWLLGKDENGRRRVWNPGSLNRLLADVAEAGIEIASGNSGNVVRQWAGKANPLVRVPFEVASGRKFSGGSVTPRDMQGMDDDSMAEENARRGGIPAAVSKALPGNAAQQQYALESVAGAVRFMRNLTSKDTDDRGTNWARGFGGSTYSFGPNDRAAEQLGKNADRWKREFVNAAARGDQATMERVIQQYVDARGNPEELLAELRTGLTNQAMNQVLDREERRELSRDRRFAR